MTGMDDPTFEAFLIAMEEFISGFYGMDDWEPPSYDEVAMFFNDQGLSLTDDVYNFLLEFDPENDPTQVD